MNLAITGGTGTLGHALVKLVHSYYEKIFIVSRDERKQAQMEADLPYDNLRFVLCDVRDYVRLSQVLENADVVVHAAALKQIDRCEYNPTECIQTNVDGSSNVVRACLAVGIEKAVLVSTDKAVNPINLYGATKLCGEKLFLAANSFNQTEFSVVRYGNVLGSRGSLVEKLVEWRRTHQKVPLTDVRMTRFWMDKKKAAELVAYALICEEVGVFVPTIEAKSVHKLCRELYPDCEFDIVGMRPGEKVHELLVADGETVYRVTEGSHTTCHGPWGSNDVE